MENFQGCDECGQQAICKLIMGEWLCTSCLRNADDWEDIEDEEDFNI